MTFWEVFFRKYHLRRKTWTRTLRKKITVVIVSGSGCRLNEEVKVLRHIQWEEEPEEFAFLEKVSLPSGQSLSRCEVYCNSSRKLLLRMRRKT
jgi:hypothetical protein